MFKKRTSKKFKRDKSAAQLLDLNVNSPRILVFKSLGYFGKLLKYTLIIGLLVGLGVGGTKAFRKVFLENDEYLLKKIDLRTNGSFTAQRLVEQTLIRKGATMFSIDVDLIEKTLSKLDEVESVSVKRVLPDKLVVNMIEHLPIAWLQLSDNSIVAGDRSSGLLIGDDGILFKCEGGMVKMTENLPVLHVRNDKLQKYKSGEKLLSVEVNRAIDLINKNKLWKQSLLLRAVKVDNFYTLLADYNDNLTVCFGMYDHERQLKDLQKLLAHANSLNKSLTWLDLRPKNNIPGLYRDPNEIKVKPGKR